ncbi:MAG TPA: hypothetical protein VIT85_05585 [Solirubrobacterales bacterium]
MTCVALSASLAGSAAAANLTVTTLDDSPEAAECSISVFECSLRHAIGFANTIDEASTIEFEVEGTIELEGEQLPSTIWPMTIDATTLANYEGEPLVEIDGSALPTEGLGTDGLHANSRLNVYGLAIGGFTNGIYDNSTKDVNVCSSYLGVRLDGETARPNAYGLFVNGEFEGSPPIGIGSTIGTDCDSGVAEPPIELGGNLISGNELAGVYDEGDATLIAANWIGLDALGESLANGSASPLPHGGVVAAGTASETTVGRYFIEGTPIGAPNTIAFNVGPGVWIESASSETWVKRNSIHSNDGLGIEIDEEAPAAPTIASFGEANGLATAAGTIETAAPESGELEFFANADCDPSGAGEGELFLGSGEYETDDGGQGTFSVDELLSPPPGATAITATATGDTVNNTTGFSACFEARPQPPAEEKQPPASTPPAGDGPHPVNGRVVVAEVQEGTILVKKPGEKAFEPLRAGEEIPVGSIVDATKGKVVLTTINASGQEQSATFFGGKFLVQQNKGSGLVTLTLKGGDFSSCGKQGQASASKRAGRSLWGSGKGNFKTKGNHGSATVRGTIWFTEDRCGSTFFKVKQGAVTVRDFDDRRTLKLAAGKSYTAAP